MSPHEWKILEWDENPRTDKQKTDKIKHVYNRNILASLCYFPPFIAIRQ